MADLLRLICLIVGIALVIWGWVVWSIPLMIIGAILAAIGGVWILILASDGGGGGGFDFNPFD